jgi:ariadne-1
MGDWSLHGAGTGGYYKCNKYEEQIKTDKNLLAEEKKREDAKNELQRYMFYYERYANHDKAERYARSLIPVI